MFEPKRIKHWLIVGILVVTVAQVQATEPEGPPCQNKCSARSTLTTVLSPVARAFFVDATMYGGLVAIWPDYFKPSAGTSRQFAYNFRHGPEWDGRRIFFRADGDPFVINGILHPIYGSEIFLAARTMGHTPLRAFIYAAAASATWEYFIEGWFQRPSLIDLAWTPFAGAVVGEFRYMGLIAVKTKVSNRFIRGMFMTMLDPLGQLERLILGCAPHH